MPEHATGLAPRLRPDEIAALTVYATGHVIEVAAPALGVSSRTIRRAGRRAAARLGATGTTHAVALAMHHGLIDPDHILRRRLLPWPKETSTIEEADRA